MIPATRAEFTFELPIKLNVSFESQNIMKPSYVLNGEYKTMIDYWSYGHSIKNIYVASQWHADNAFAHCPQRFQKRKRSPCGKVPRKSSG